MFLGLIITLSYYNHHKPKPIIYDEFSYMLLADNLLSP